jgi:hypothetical protein
VLADMKEKDISQRSKAIKYNKEDLKGYSLRAIPPLIWDFNKP